MNFRIYEVTHNLYAPLQPIEDGSPIRESIDTLFEQIYKNSLYERIYREAEEQEQTAANPKKPENTKYYEISLEDLKKMAAIITTGNDDIIEHKELGSIILKAGEPKVNHGMGIKHIIASRVSKGIRNENILTTILALVCSALHNGGVKKSFDTKGNDLGRYEITKNGIEAIITKIKDKDGVSYLLTGYALDSKEKEATEAIQTVIAQYGYAPEFSSFRKQVGAIVSSIN
jgi:hypothetical protein